MSGELETPTHAGLGSREMKLSRLVRLDGETELSVCVVRYGGIPLGCTVSQRD